MTDRKWADKDIRQAFLDLEPQDAADAFIRIRNRAKRLGDIREFETGILLAKLAAELDLTEAQKGRLQMICHEAGARIIEAVREYDKNSPALHPLDSVGPEEKDNDDGDV